MHDLTISQQLSIAAERHSDRPWVSIDGQEHTYQSAYELSAKYAETLEQLPVNALVGVLGNRSLENYHAVYSVFLANRCLVPLSPKFPTERLRSILDQSQVAVVLYDTDSEEQVAILSKEFPSLPFRRIEELRETEIGKVEVTHENLPSDFQYLLFTSGSTGLPKGVGVTTSNVASYLANFFRLYSYEPNDRVSQTFELTFDLGMHDLFTTWTTGACLVPLSTQDLLFSANFIRKNNLSIWFSVPSVARMMDQIDSIQSGKLGSLRLSMFCGEALPTSLATKWRTAAPNSKVVNLYGPTEATIAISSYELADNSVADHKGLVSLGAAYPEQKLGLFTKTANGYEPVPDDQTSGLLCLNGNQVTPGYWNDSKKTAEAFFDYADERWYITGDIAMFENGRYYYLGRNDSQVQIQGHRVELLEVEYALKQITNSQLCIALALPYGSTIATEIVAICSSTDLEESQILHEVKTRLPGYMSPRSVHILSDFPTNSNGKVDRNALAKLLDLDD